MRKRGRNKIKDLFKKVKLLILDVDGVLTKGEIIYDNQGRELKIFNVKDGLSIFLLSRLGINTIIITAKQSDVVNKRAKDMRVAQVIGGILPKSRVIDSIKKRYGVSEEEICFIGDDLIDLSIMRKVGVPVTVKDAPLDVKKAALYITKKGGGEGAVREVAELILKAKKLWSRLVEDFDKIVKNN
jgi:3-deoxy-D-manno-octulosonate 8-phosphate phosphatase (KDO 8-P phosphatase)